MKRPPFWQYSILAIIEVLIAMAVLGAAVSLWHWYSRQEGGTEVIYTIIVVALGGLITARRWLHGWVEGTVVLSPTTWSTPTARLAPLRRQMEQAFNLSQIQGIVFDLDLDYENLAGITKEQKIIALLETCQSETRLSALFDVLQRTRPDIQWAQPDLIPLGINRNRTNLLNHLQTTWVDGFLKQSIHSEILKLTLSYHPEMVGQRPWELLLKEHGRDDQPVPPDRSLREIFTSAGHNLLILGEPGSGKTITLLQLAESLIGTARQEPTAPIPLILNLSSWGRAQKPLADWLVEEVFTQYGMARALTQGWVAQNQFIYLLDGLDEVPSEARLACLQAINAFKEAHSAEMAVCSRIAEYKTLVQQHTYNAKRKRKSRNKALTQHLHLGTAVQIKPLNEAQVEAYLGREELEMQAVRATLRHDPDLREMAASPLLLSLMTLAYRGMSTADLQPLTDKDARRRHLFDHYIKQMFARRPVTTEVGYSAEQAQSWLTNIAKGMVRHEQYEFYIEKLQPTWLRKERHNFALIIRLILGIFFGLFFGLPGWLIGGWAGWLIIGLLIGIIRNQDNEIELKEVLRWRWPGIDPILSAFLRSSLRIGLIVGLIVGLKTGLIGGLIFGLYVGLWCGGLIGLGTGMFLGIERQETVNRLVPNQSIHQSLRNVFTFMWWGIWGGLVLGLLVYGLLGYGVLAGMSLGIVFSFAMSFQYDHSFKTVIQHYVLRWLLAREGVLPYPFRDERLITFLDGMHERILLRRVGGGWIFVHRSLLDYFANLAKDEIGSSED